MEINDAPDEYELRQIARHPLTRRLNRELLECLRRWEARKPPDNKDADGLRR